MKVDCELIVPEQTLPLGIFILGGLDPIFMLEACCLDCDFLWLCAAIQTCGIAPHNILWNDTDRENRSTGRKTCRSATVSTNLTWTDLGLNPGLCGLRLTTNHLRHVTVYKVLSSLERKQSSAKFYRTQSSQFIPAGDTKSFVVFAHI
jgi:hypothetical protein